MNLNLVDNRVPLHHTRQQVLAALPSRGAEFLARLGNTENGRITAPKSSGRFEIDMILGAIAEAAQTLTAATGAAVAMRREGVMICRGRSGMTAPSLGAQLSINTGLSGDCLRTGKTLRCDDTEKDYRADPDACRRMGGIL